MTEVQKAEILLQKVKLLSEELLTENDTNNATEENCLVEKYINLSEALQSFLMTLNKFKNRVNEKDENKRIYGAKTIEKLLGIIKEFDVIYTTFNERLKEKYQLKANKLLKQNLEFLESEKKKKEKEENDLITKRLDETVEEENNRLSILKEKIKIEEDKKKEKEEKEKQLEVAKKLKEKEQHEIRLMVEEMEIFYENEREETLCVEGLYKLAINHFKELPNIIAHIYFLFDQICRDPSVLSLRVIRICNKSFQQSFGLKCGVSTILRAFGFKTRITEQIKPLLKQLQIDTESSSEFYFVLEEPDMLKNYNEWLQWITKIENVRNIIKDVQQNVGYVKSYECFISYIQAMHSKFLEKA